MRIDKRFVLAAVGLGAGAMIVGQVWAGSGPDRLMDVTTHMTMQMPGMPAMPPRTMQHQVCMPAGKFDPHAMQRAVSRGTKHVCRVEHYAMHGNQISYDMMCKAPNAVTSHAVVQLKGDGGFTGTTHTVVNAAGHAMTMDGTYTAKRVGSCTYTPPASS